MTFIELDENELRKKLIEVYEKYLFNQKDKENLSEMDKVEQNYSSAYELIKSKTINRAVNLAGSIEEKEVSGSNTFLDDKDLLFEAKKMLEDLKSGR